MPLLYKQKVAVVEAASNEQNPESDVINNKDPTHSTQQILANIPPPLNTGFISRVSNQNGVSLLYIMFEIHQSGREPSI